mmetsp:Transcript_47521/g.124548  ORF Transcript_47521/g.124548 Transcript_47521/m.124548 type:complete len:206 (-) Transcript_47521:248-865(-)
MRSASLQEPDSRRETDGSSCGEMSVMTVTLRPSCSAADVMIARKRVPKMRARYSSAGWFCSRICWGAMTSRKCSTSSVAIEAIDTCRVHTRPSTKEGERHNGGHEPSQPSDHMAADLDEVAPCTPRMYRCGSALAPVPHSTTTNEAIGTASGQSARAILAQMRRAPREVASVPMGRSTISACLSSAHVASEASPALDTLTKCRGV